MTNNTTGGNVEKDFRVDETMERLLPTLKPDELRNLEKSIKQEGCRDPLVIGVINGERILVDGHNRHHICKNHGISFATIDMAFEDLVDARVWMRRNAVSKRNLNDAQVIDLESANKDDLAEKGREKRKATEGRPPKKLLSIVDNSFDSPKHNTRREVAKRAGVSTGKVAMAEVVKKKAPEVWQKALDGELTVGAAYKVVKQQGKIADLEQEKKKIAEQTRESHNPPVVSVCDWREWVDTQSQCDLLLTDPPYSTDVDDIESFAANWLPAALDKVKPTGRAYIFVGAYPRELAAYMAVKMPDQVLVWTYRNTIGPSPRDSYKLNWQAILYFKGAKSGPLDCPVMVEQFSVQDITAPDGRHHNRYHAWQKPDQVAERFIRHATKPGDLVLDPFCCTGTFPLAAARLGRIGRGCDISEEAIAIAKERGCVVA